MKKFIFIFILFLGIFQSCQDEILDRAPLDSLSGSIVWNDATLVESYVAHVYGGLPFMHYGNLVSTDGNTIYDLALIEALTDQAGGSRINRNSALKKVGNTTEQGGLLEMWLYGNIRKMNEFYEYIGPSTLQEAEKNTFIGAIKFAEAFTYFEMAKRYGAIPIITKAQRLDDPEEELFPPRNPEAEVYSYAIGLLDEILENNFLKVTEKAGYPTKGAALALKSRIALHAASIARFSTEQLNGLLGVPKSDEAKYWQMAYDAANAVISSGSYSLYYKHPEDLSNRFYQMSIDKDNPERIFVKKYDGTNVGHSYDNSIAPLGFSDEWQCGNVVPYLDFVESFEKIDGSSSIIPRDLETTETLVTPDELFGGYDPRMSGAIFLEGSIYQGKEINFYKGLRLPDGSILDSKSGVYEGVPSWGLSRIGNETHVLHTGFSIKKYVNEDYIAPQVGLSSTDKVIFRLGEMYLIRAEAAFYMNKGDKGLADINVIRSRAGMPARTAITEDAIRYERMAELCFEDGARYWDLIRWRTAVEAITKDFSGLRLIKDFETGKYLVRFETFVSTASPYEARFGQEHYYKPITPGRISNNPRLAPENPGY